MKKLIFLTLVLLVAACTSNDPEPTNGGPTPIISDNPPGEWHSQDNAIDPGCHGGEWFETHNLLTITPWQYGEWATFVIKAQVPQVGLGGMGPVQIKYKVKNFSASTKVRLNFAIISGSWSGNFTPLLNPGQSSTYTLTVSSCQPAVAGGWYEYQFGLMFQNMGGGSNANVSGEILSVTGLDCPNFPYCAEHKTANHDQGFTWTVQP